MTFVIVITMMFFNEKKSYLVEGWRRMCRGNRLALLNKPEMYTPCKK